MRRVLGTTIVMLAASGCFSARPRPFIGSPDPSLKIPAFKQAVREKDRSKIAPLVADLENDDPAVRMYAIEALHRLTGQRLGYVYWDGDDQRQAAVRRWQDWIHTGQNATPPVEPATVMVKEKQ